MEGALDVRERLVVPDRIGRGHLFFWYAGADHIDAIERGFGADLILQPTEVEVLIADLEREVLTDLVFVEHATDPKADRRLPLEPAALDAGAYALKLQLGRFQQRLTLVRAQLGQLRIATGNQPLARVVRMRQFEQIALIEEAQLQRFGFNQ